MNLCSYKKVSKLVSLKPVAAYRFKRFWSLPKDNKIVHVKPKIKYISSNSYVKNAHLSGE